MTSNWIPEVLLFSPLECIIFVLPAKKIQKNPEIQMSKKHQRTLTLLNTEPSDNPWKTAFTGALGDLITSGEFSGHLKTTKNRDR